MHTKVDNELSNLETGNPLFPPNTHATGTLEVIPVHHNVDHKVKCNWDPRDRSKPNQLSVAEEGGGSMVISVEEGKRFLLQDKENSIKKLNVFRDVVQLRTG